MSYTGTPHLPFGDCMADPVWDELRAAFRALRSAMEQDSPAVAELHQAYLRELAKFLRLPGVADPSVDQPPQECDDMDLLGAPEVLTNDTSRVTIRYEGPDSLCGIPMREVLGRGLATLPPELLSPLVGTLEIRVRYSRAGTETLRRMSEESRCSCVG